MPKKYRIPQKGEVSTYQGPDWTKICGDKSTSCFLSILLPCASCKCEREKELRKHGVNFGHTLAQLGDRSWSHPCHKTAGWFTSQHFLC